MKRVIIVMLVVVTGLSLNAQPAANKLFVGGNFNFSCEKNKEKSGSTTNDLYNTTTFNVSPSVGYFLSDKIAIGASVGLNLIDRKYNSGVLDKFTYTTFSCNPFARYYLISGQGGIFAEANVGISTGKQKNKYTNGATDEENITKFTTGIAPGAYYCVSPKIMLECKFGWFGYSSVVNKDDNNGKLIVNDFGMTLNPSSLSFGIVYVL